MTRRDYEHLAVALAKAKAKLASSTCGPFAAVEVVEQAIIDVAQRDNPRFNVEKFRAAAEDLPQ